MRIKDEFKSVLTLKTATSSTPWMVVVALGVMVPLFFGIYRDEAELLYLWRTKRLPLGPVYGVGSYSQQT